MKEGPDISRLAALIGDPARANILLARLGGKALTASELAEEAGVTPATASSHLAQLSGADLIWPRKQGRHRYFALKDADVAAALEGLIGLAALKGGQRTRTGPRDEALHTARICYDHLAGRRAVQMFDAMAQRGFLEVDRDHIALSATGVSFVDGIGVDVAALHAARRPLCRVCLDWSERRSHLSGALGAAMLQRFTDLKWIRRQAGSRQIHFTAAGTREFAAAFPI